MRWPWKRPIVEHRSSLTDQVVTAILAAASGGGTRPALATAALETAATLYGSALASCEISGPSVVTRALDATWRAATASELIRRGQCVYIIGADPVDGLAPGASRSLGCTSAGRVPASWYYRVRAWLGPSGTAWETHSAAEVLHHALVDRPRAPMGGCQSATACGRYRQSRGWLDKRLSPKKRAGRSVAFCRWRDTTPTPT